MKERITFLLAALCLLSTVATSQHNTVLMAFQNSVVNNIVSASIVLQLDYTSVKQSIVDNTQNDESAKNKATSESELHSITSVFPDPVGQGQKLYIPNEEIDGATRMEMITIYGKLVKTLDLTANDFTMPKNLEYGTYFISVYRGDVINNFMITVD